MDIRRIVKALTDLVRHMRYESRGTLGASATENLHLVPELEDMCDGVEILTWIHCRPNDHVNSDNEMHRGNRIQNACDPFILTRYGVSSFMVRVSERVQIGEEKLDL